MKKALAEAIETLIEKSVTYGQADDILKVAEAARNLADAAMVLKDIDALDVPDEVVQPEVDPAPVPPFATGADVKPLTGADLAEDAGAGDVTP